MQEILARIEPRRFELDFPTRDYYEDRELKLSTAHAAFIHEPTAKRMIQFIELLAKDGHCGAEEYLKFPEKTQQHLRYDCDYSVKEFLDVRDVISASLISISSGMGGKNRSGLYVNYEVSLWKAMQQAATAAEDLVTIVTKPFTISECYSVMRDFKVIREKNFLFSDTGYYINPRLTRGVPILEIRPSNFLVSNEWEQFKLRPFVTQPAVFSEEAAIEQLQGLIEPRQNPETCYQNLPDYYNERRDELDSAVSAFNNERSADNMINLINTISADRHSIAQGYMALPGVLETHLDHLPDYTIKEFLDIRDALNASLSSLYPDFAGRHWGNLFETYEVALWDVMHKAHSLAQQLVTMAIDPNPTSAHCFSIVKKCAVIKDTIEGSKAEFAHLVDGRTGLERQIIASMVLDPTAGSRIPLKDVRPSTFLKR